MQGILCVPDGHLQTGSSPPPNNSNVPNLNTDSLSDNEINTKELLIQSNKSDSGILSGTGTSATLEMDNSNCLESIEELDNRSTCSSPSRKYLCPICEIMLTSQHEFTKHIRSHNNESDLDSEKGFVCRICCKVLSSNASLDRHVLIHSGERPFKCTYCGDTFTTNGNMHRHIRTHIHKSESCESDEGSDSGASSSCKTIEYNNNKVTAENDNNKNIYVLMDMKRKYNDNNEDSVYKNCRIKLEKDYDSIATYSCAVCTRKDFLSLESLEIHMEDNHPDYPAKCHPCNQIFKNKKILSDHKIAVHSVDENLKVKNSVTGFKDLTFVDFSSQKFPIIARYECEKNLHKVSSGLKFQCDKCGRAFPCASSLEIHQSNCAIGLDLSVKNKNIPSAGKTLTNLEKDMIRNDFFARLDLQNNSEEKYEKPIVGNAIKSTSVSTSPDNNKDLADIQSIISMTTNGTLLQQLQTKGVDVNFTLPPIYNESEHLLKQDPEEESQDIFAAEFRKMKVRGEFPCRLCKAVFPNLRALKGHNRAHFNGNNSGTYLCNMCPHTTVDKAALIRHMRTHNGDRPYECALCNYAFTTKANCERHLRNRHAKATREEVKKSIIYHPSEDPSNDDINKILSREETAKPGFSVGIKQPYSEKSTDSYSPDFPTLLSDRLSADISRSFNKYQSIDNMNGFNHIPEIVYPKITDKMYNEQSKPHVDSKVIQESYMPNFNFSPKISNTSTPQKSTPKLCVKKVEDLKEDTPSYEYAHSISPTISQPDVALDLSTKKIKHQQIEEPQITKVSEVECDQEPKDLSKKSTIPEPKPTDILAQRLLKNTPKIDPAGLYASQMALYRNGFAGVPGLSSWPFAFNPLLLPPIPQLIPQDPQEIKERLQRLQLCGGGMVMDNFAERLKNFQQQSLSNANVEPYNQFNVNDNSSESTHKKSHTMLKPTNLKPLILSTDHILSDSSAKMLSPIAVQKSEPIQSPNSLKMIIKNGVLMPKQKQRRYRTERPFSCEYCSARFTLRSNMERHIKQQHPQYWKQRQRTGGIGAPGRKISSSTPVSNTCDLNIPNYEASIKPEFHDGNDNEMTDKIKYAILAQHLKAAQNYNFTKDMEYKEEDEEDDCDLIIDEVDDSVKTKNGLINFSTSKNGNNNNDSVCINKPVETIKNEEAQDLVSVSRLLDNASQQPFKEYFQRDAEVREDNISEEDEEGLVASGSTSDATDENRSESENIALIPPKKKSAYSLAPNRVCCPYCQRKFPWSSSLRRHVLTHTGQKPFKCSHCPLLFTTKSNCDRHLLRKHGNSATAVNNEAANNSSSYMMRNVPERPFKCSNCPSSTFSTYSNLKKHINCKHSTQCTQSDDARSQVSTGYEGGSSEDEKVPIADTKTEWDKQLNIHKAPVTGPEGLSHLQASDLPFKCHLCDSSFGDRQDALDHIKDKHKLEYEILLSKNALDVGAIPPDEQLQHDDNEDIEVRGRFPDYANRKVICAFCMRRFWSAEDLRRHMRTHTGERPFSCDICQRRFTLKHSMLRHRKKHNVPFENDNNVNSDEDVNNGNYTKSIGIISNNLVSKAHCDKTDESDGNEGSDLIGNLLGIRDRSIIDQVLGASADDAAKLLGVRDGERE